MLKCFLENDMYALEDRLQYKTMLTLLPIYLRWKNDLVDDALVPTISHIETSLFHKQYLKIKITKTRNRISMKQKYVAVCAQ